MSIFVRVRSAAWCLCLAALSSVPGLACDRRAPPPPPPVASSPSASQSERAAPGHAPIGLVRVSDATGRVGFIDRTGAVLVPPQFSSLDVLHPADGLVAARQHGLWGFLDERGSWKIPATFAVAYSFSEGLAAVSLAAAPRAFGYVDAAGQLAITPQFDSAGAFSEGRAAVKLNGAPGIVDRAGAFLPTGSNLVVSGFSEGLARFTSHDHIGFLNEKAEVVIAPRFEQALSFSQGFAAVQVGKLWGYIDASGKYLVKPRFLLAESFACGIAKVAMTQSELGFVDLHGKQFGRYQANTDCRNGYAAVQQNELWGFIDPSGALVIPPKFATLEGGFVEGVAAVAEPNRPYGYIGTDGKYVIEPRFTQAAEFQNGLARVELVNAGEAVSKFGYIDHQGAFVWGPFPVKP